VVGWCDKCAVGEGAVMWVHCGDCTVCESVVRCCVEMFFICELWCKASRSVQLHPVFVGWMPLSTPLKLGCLIWWVCPYIMDG
jgi:hypothetical protein